MSGLVLSLVLLSVPPAVPSPGVLGAFHPGSVTAGGLPALALPAQPDNPLNGQPGGLEAKSDPLCGEDLTDLECQLLTRGLELERELAKTEARLEFERTARKVEVDAVTEKWKRAEARELAEPEESKARLLTWAVGGFLVGVAAGATVVAVLASRL